MTMEDTATKEPDEKMAPEEPVKPVAEVDLKPPTAEGKSFLDVSADNNEATAMTTAGQGRSTAGRQWLVGLACVVVLIVVIIVAVVALPDRSSDVGDGEPPVAINFETGVSLITSYNINATISHRLARTVINMEIANALDCTSIHVVTLQLPLAARVAALRTIADDGCATHGEVQELQEARETFVETAAKGLQGAYVEARDGATYSLQVSLPPMGTTKVEMVLEEILRQRVGQVEFQLPLVPNEQVDQVALEVSILDVGTAAPTEATFAGNSSTYVGSSGDGADFRLDIGSELVPGQVGLIKSPYSLVIPDAREYDLPAIMSGSFVPGVLPDEGVLHRDGNCFEYSFLPGSLQPKSKNIFFLLDTYQYQQPGGFFVQAKQALQSAIDSLTDQDTLTIQTFGRRGTEDLWGSTKATDSEKVEAKRFVSNLVGRSSYGTNFHEALLEGLLRANRDAEKDREDGVVTLVVVISNSWASTGNTNRSKIASDVWNLNQKGDVKIFSIGSSNADLELLRAMSIMNGGVTASVAKGATSLASQMEGFFESEFGSILLSDVQVAFDGDAVVYGATPRDFAVLADGTEVVVRGLLSANDGTSLQEASLRAVTTAIAPGGSQTWTTAAVADPFVASLGLPNSRCFQSYAHSRVTQLMHLREVALLLGDGVVEPVVSLTKPCIVNETTSFADCIKAEALALALEAQLVTEGLTGLVTIDKDQCLVVDEDAEVCLDGTNPYDSYWNEHTAADAGAAQPMAASYGGDSGRSYGYSASPNQATSMWSSLLVSGLALVAILMAGW